MSNIHCTDSQVEFTKGTIPHLESGSIECTVKQFKSAEDEYSRLKMDTAIRRMDYHPEIMCHYLALCRHVTLPSYTQVLVKAVTKIFGLILNSPKKCLWTKRRVRSTN